MSKIIAYVNKLYKVFNFTCYFYFILFYFLFFKKTKILPYLAKRICHKIYIKLCLQTLHLTILFENIIKGSLFLGEKMEGHNFLNPLLC